MARTTTIRRAPASTTSSTLPRSMPPIANHGRVPGGPAGRLGGVTHQVEADGGPSRFRGSRPHGPHAEVVESFAPGRGSYGGVHLLGAVGGQADHGVLAEEAAGGVKGNVLLPDMEHRRPDREPMSARSLTAHSRPWRCAAACRTSRSSSSSLASSDLSRSWMMSTPPVNAASTKSAKSPRSRRASVHK